MAPAKDRPSESAPGAGGLTHIDGLGRARMVDVTAKPLTRRVAVARCRVVSAADTAPFLSSTPEGVDPLEEARFAGVLAAKRTSTLIPLCHPILLEGITVDIAVMSRQFVISARAEIVERTGVEMEALTACAVAGLTLLQALLDVDPDAHMEELTLWRKSGGRSGNWERKGPEGRMTHS